MATRTLSGEKAVGRFSVEFELANYEDMALANRGLLPPDKVRRQTIKGVVDNGAAMLVLPQSVVKQLGLRLKRKAKVRYADGRTRLRWEAAGAHVELLGRDDTFSAVVEPQRKDALIGAIVLEALDLLVDSRNQRLIPRDASGPIYEIE
jgi:predicted aspartyl protease